MSKVSTAGLAKRLDWAIKRTGMSPRAVSLAVDKGPDLVRKIMSHAGDGKEYFPRIDSIAALAGVLGVELDWLATGNGSPDGSGSIPSSRIPVRGTVAAGTWLETAPLLEDHEITDWIDDLSFTDTGGEFIYALEVRGTSLNKLIPPSNHLICRDIASGIDVKSGDLVIVERITAQGGMREVTGKRLIRENGTTVLKPESNDPKWQTPIVIDELQEGDEVRIIARVERLVISSF